MAVVFLATLLYRADAELGKTIVEKLLKADYDVSTSEGSQCFCRDKYKREDCVTISIIGKQCSMLMQACIEYQNLYGAPCVTTSLGPQPVASSYVDSSCAGTPVLPKKKGGKRLRLMFDTPGSVASDTVRTEELSMPFFKLADDGPYGNAILAAFFCLYSEGEIAVMTIEVLLILLCIVGAITLTTVQIRILSRFVTHMTIGGLTNASYLARTRR